MSVSAIGAMLIEFGFETQISLDRLERIAPAARSAYPIPAPPERDDSERVKVSLDERQFRRLCNLARREFESLATIGSRMIEMGIERYDDRYGRVS